MAPREGKKAKKKMGPNIDSLAKIISTNVSSVSDVNFSGYDEGSLCYKVCYDYMKRNSLLIYFVKHHWVGIGMIMHTVQAR